MHDALPAYLNHALTQKNSKPLSHVEFPTRARLRRSLSVPDPHPNRAHLPSVMAHPVS